MGCFIDSYAGFVKDLKKRRKCRINEDMLSQQFKDILNTYKSLGFTYRIRMFLFGIRKKWLLHAWHITEMFQLEEAYHPELLC